MLPVEYLAEVTRRLAVPVMSPALQALAKGGSTGTARASLARLACGQRLCCAASFPCSVQDGEATGQLMVLVTGGSAGTVPGGTSSVLFGKGGEMIDQHGKHLCALQECLLICSISRSFGSTVMLIELPHACLYINPEHLSKTLNASTVASSTDGLREVCDAQTLGLKSGREKMLSAVSSVI